MEKRCGLWDPAEAIETFCAMGVLPLLTYRHSHSPSNGDGRNCAERKIETAKSSTVGPQGSAISCNLQVAGQVGSGSNF